MICIHCGQEVSNSSFCPFCGTKVPVSNSFSKALHEHGFTKKNFLVVVSLLIVIIVLLLLLLLDPFNEKRTVMIYVAGSNLESDSRIVSSDLAALDSNKIDLKTTNVLVYAGGAKKWHNFISNEDNGIYILEKSGFKKIESLKLSSLGDPDNLSYFLNYAVKHYGADKYDLILYDHGGAIDGAIYDELFDNDNLTLEEMAKAFNNSPFNKNHKLETIVFNTCLNGTIEVANIFKDFAKYLIASEEISYGSSETDTLGFLNQVSIKDTGLTYGKKFIDNYERKMEIIDLFGTCVRTYSLIDLSKIEKINTELDTYISGFNLVKEFKNISLVRENLYQYGTDDKEFDTVDLYSFIENSKAYSSSGNADKLQKMLSEAIKYNKSNQENSFGLSIYFPYNGRYGSKNKYLNVYKNLNYSEKYKEFINNFYTMQKSPSNYSFSIQDNEISTTTDQQTFSLKLTEEQLSTFASGNFRIFKRDAEHPNYYFLLFTSDDIILDGDILRANVDNKFLKIVDKDDSNKKVYIPVYYEKSNKSVRNVYAILPTPEDISLVSSDSKYFTNVIFYIKEKENKPFIASTKLRSNDERVNGVLIDLDQYNDYEIPIRSYKILDESGNYVTNWEQAPILWLMTGELRDIELLNSSLDLGDYYIVFGLRDIYGNVSYSKLMKVGE